MRLLGDPGALGKLARVGSALGFATVVLMDPISFDFVASKLTFFLLNNTIGARMTRLVTSKAKLVGFHLELDSSSC